MDARIREVNANAQMSLARVIVNRVLFNTKATIDVGLHDRLDQIVFEELTSKGRVYIIEVDE